MGLWSCHGLQQSTLLSKFVFQLYEKENKKKKQRQGKLLSGDLDSGSMFTLTCPEESKKQREGTFQPTPNGMKLFTLWRL